MAYVTCGPFECVEGMDAPELSIANSAVCTAWDPMVEIQVGEIDNDVLSGDNNADQNDGVDLGIVTSSSVAMSVKHVFSGVANGRNTSVTTDAAKGSNKTLAMKAVSGVIVVDGDDPFSGDTAETDYVACEETYDAGSLTDEPKGCFRLLGPGAGRSDNDASKGANYLTGWSLELSPKDANVTWGRVAWEDDPFEDLTCGAAEPVMVSDHVDVCEMFDAEVSLATGKGWKPTVVFSADDNQVVMWKASASAGTGTSRFKTVWFDDNLNGKILKDTVAPRPDPDGDGPGTAAGAQATIHDLYNAAGREDNINVIWEFLTDSDGDLTAGDLGKADLVSDRDDFKTADDETTIGVEECAAGVTWSATNTAGIASGCDGSAASVVDTTKRATHPDGKADNYAADNTDFSDFRACSEGDGGDDDDGSICDAVWTRDAEILFADGTFGCSTTRMVSITCTWDADGGMAQGRNALPDAFDGEGDGSNLANFLKCEAE